MNKLKHNFKLRKLCIISLFSILLIWGIATFLLYPNITLIRDTLFPNGQFEYHSILQIIKSARVGRALKNTFILAVSLTVTVNLIGVFEILVLDYYEVKGRKWLNIAYHAPLICNGMVLVIAYNFLFGNQGFVTANLMQRYPDINPNWFRGFGAVLLEMTLAGTSNHIMFVRDALRGVDYQTIEAAKNLGVKESRILRKVVLPTMKPSIFAASILTFTIGISAFATPQVLGGETFETINPLILSFSRTLSTRNYAAILAMFLGLVTIVVLCLSNYIEKKKNYKSVSKVKTSIKRMKISNPVYNITICVIAHILALAHTIPLLFILIFSFMPVQDLYKGIIDVKNMTLNNYYSLLSSTTGLQPVLTSIVYAILAAGISVAIMLFVGRVITKYRNKCTTWLELVLHIPWFLPGTLIALGLVTTFAKPNILTMGKTLTGTTYILLIGYVIMRIPYTLRMIKAAYTNLDTSLEEASKNLGASTWKTFYKVLFPVLCPTILSVIVLNFIGQLAEYNVSVFLFHPKYQPLGVVLNTATSPDASPEAQMLTFVYSVIIMVVCTISIIVVQKSKNKD